MSTTNMWSNDVVLEFIELYRREEHLWDTKHSLHRNRGEISLAWTRIQSTLSLNFSIEDLKKKKESLMTSFRLHWNRKRRSPKYRISWFAYPYMERFLGARYELDNNDPLKNEPFENTESYSRTHTHSHNSEPASCRNTNAIVEKSNRILRKARTTPCQQRTIPYGSDLAAKNDTDESSAYTKYTNDDKQSLDEYDLYCQLLVKKLRKLDEHQRDVAMHEIDKIMFRSKMQSSSTQSKTSSYSTSPSPVPRNMKSPIFIVTRQNQTQYEDVNISYQELQEHNIQPDSS